MSYESPIKQGKQQLNSDIGFILEDNYVAHINKKKEQFSLKNERINQKFKTHKMNALTSVIVNGKTGMDNFNNNDLDLEGLGSQNSIEPNDEIITHRQLNKIIKTNFYETMNQNTNAKIQSSDIYNKTKLADYYYKTDNLTAKANKTQPIGFERSNKPPKKHRRQVSQKDPIPLVTSLSFSKYLSVLDRLQYMKNTRIINDLTCKKLMQYASSLNQNNFHKIYNQNKETHNLLMKILQSIDDESLQQTLNEELKQTNPSITPPKYQMTSIYNSN